MHLALLLAAPLLQGTFPALLPPEQSDRRLEPTRLLLKTLDWDTRNGQPTVPEPLRYTPQEVASAGYYFVQGTPDTIRDLGASIRELGGQTFDYIPHNAWEAQVPAGLVDTVRGLSQAVVPVHPGYKMDPEIGRYGTHLEDPQGRLLIAVEYWPGVDLEDEENALRALDALIVESHESGRYQRSLVRVDPMILTAVARQPGVKWMQESAPAVQRNDKSEWVIQSYVSGSTPLWNQGVTGKDAYIGHIDGKIHEASCFFDDPSGVAPGPSHRKIKYWNAPGGSDSHGTHTAGSAAGNKTPVNGQTQYNGMAPDAFLVHRAGFPSSSSYLSWLNTHHSNGGRIHTNSWGNDWTTAYDLWCRDIDAYSHDSEDGVVLHAVTNLSTLKNPENAKSCLAVAATSRSNPENLGSGGRGPTADGRRKPEVFAPGCSTFSASVATCGTTTMCGTSMACPVVAGACALMKQYFEDGYWPSGSANAADGFTPSGSLLRAAMANSAVDMAGISGYTGNQEGFGRILLDNTAYFSGDSRRLLLADRMHANGITHGQQLQFKVTIPSGSSELRATLCFADEPGAAFASNPVVNDLNVLARDPNGNIYHGNIMSSATGEATPNPSTQDAKNSLEMILVSSPTPGTWWFRVEGKDVPVGPQGWAGILTY